MRFAVVCLLLAACATTSSARPPPERLAGCWINRSVGGSSVTMRWLPDPGRPGALQGARHVYGQSAGPANTRYTLQSSNGGWQLCELDSAGGNADCWQVAEGEGGSLEGGRAFIDAYGERLRITVAGDGPERTLFNGQRDGCD